MNAALVIQDQNLSVLLKKHISQLPSAHLVMEASSCETILDENSLQHADLLFVDDKCLCESIIGRLSEMENAPLVLGVNISEAKQAKFADLPVFSFLALPVSFEKLYGLFDLAGKLRGQLHHSSQRRQFIFVKSDYKIVKIKFSDILFCEGMKDYTQIFLENSDTPVITLQNLKSVCEKLPASQFVRIHRSFAVAIDKIEIVTRRELIIKNRYIPIGNNYWEELSLIIHQYS